MGTNVVLAQQYSSDEFTFGAAMHTWSYRYLGGNQQYAYDHHLEDSKPSFTYTRNLSPSLAVEGAVDPVSQFLQTNSLESGRELLALGGVKAGWRGRRWGFYGKAEVGVASWSCGLFFYNPKPYSDCSRVTNFAFEYGGVVERHVAGRYSLRVDVAHLLSTEFDQVLARYQLGPTQYAEVIHPGATLQHLDLRLGITRRFGQIRDTEQEPIPAESRWDFGSSLFLLPRAEPIDNFLFTYPSPGIWASWNFSKLVGWDSTLVHSGPGRNDGLVYSGAQTGGRSLEALTGLKIGMHRDRMGYYAKVRGGAVTFGETERTVVFHSNGTYSMYRGKLTSPVLDVGGVWEVYPSRHTMLRFDADSATTFYGPKDIWQYVLQGGVEVGQRYEYPAYSETGILLGFGVGMRF